MAKSKVKPMKESKMHEKKEDKTMKKMVKDIKDMKSVKKGGKMLMKSYSQKAKGPPARDYFRDTAGFAHFLDNNARKERSKAKEIELDPLEASPQKKKSFYRRFFNSIMNFFHNRKIEKARKEFSKGMMSCY